MIETKYCISSIANNEEITLYKFDNLKSCLEKFLTIEPLDKCWWRMYKEDVVDQTYTLFGNIIYIYEMDYDFEGNDDCYISTCVNDWQEFAKQKLKEETK